MLFRFLNLLNKIDIFYFYLVGLGAVLGSVKGALIGLLLAILIYLAVKKYENKEH